VFEGNRLVSEAASASTRFLQSVLQSLANGDDSARVALIQHGLDRFRRLARHMFRPYADLLSLYETDDVLQQALIRLYKTLDEIKPDDVRALFGLMARQIRWVLLDLGRKHAGKAVGLLAASSDSIEGADMELEDPAGEPGGLLEWTHFHETIESLPEDPREMFDLLFYEGLSQAEAAEVLNVSIRTIKRRWQAARLAFQAKFERDGAILE
jgi:RNA polymerase sigma-70 factor (ECF subfamily)